VLIEPEGTVLAAPFTEAHRFSDQFGRFGDQLVGGGRSSIVDLSLPVVSWDSFADIESFPNGMAWPKKDYVIGQLEVLVPAREISSADELRKAVGEKSSRGRSSRTIRNYVDGRYFSVVKLASDDWSYRIEPGMADRPGTLWLTPTDEAIEKVRSALAEINQARQALEKSQAEAAKASAEAEQAKSAAGLHSEKNDGVNSDSK
jgi:hypothetical protein